MAGPTTGGGWSILGILKALGLVAAAGATGYMFSGSGDGIRLGDTDNTNKISVKPISNEAADRTVYMPTLGGDKYLVISATDGGTPAGLGTMSTQNANAVAITGGTVTGITDLAVADGGTGASTAAGAATNLGLGTGDSPQLTAVNVGHASDTTITRVSSGLIAVEGGNVPLENRANTFSADQSMIGGANAVTVGTPTTDATDDVTIEASSATQTPLSLELATSQTANAFEVKEQGGTIKYAIGPDGIVSPSVFYQVTDHFLYSDALTNTRNQFDLTAGGTGTSAAVTHLTTIGSRMGIWQFTTGTDTTGRAYAYSSSSAVMTLGVGEVGFESAIRLEDLSDGTDTYTARVGFSDIQTGSGSGTDVILFRYSSTENSGEWQGITRSNTTETVVDSNVAVVADTWYALRAVVNAAGTSVTFWVNGAIVGTSTTNIPTTSARATGITHAIEKSAGTNARLMYMDYYSMFYRP